MIISEQNIMFIHIPKTAGTSIVHMLLTDMLGCETSGSISSQPTPVQQTYGLGDNLKHATLTELRQHLTPEVFQRYFKFAVVRNPWDRVVSSVTWSQHKYKVFSRVPFPDMVMMIPQIQTDPSHPLYLIFREQIDFIELDGKLAVDKVCRFENIQTDINILTNEIGIGEQKLSKFNTSEHDPYQTYYTPELKNIVQTCYMKDITTFGYEFENYD